ncbi:Maf-like protein [Jiella sp. M17.18]|uniref:Maf-like protein n=1 Tax=Jiella sp. M17.18 TaxID=3234247 RepID=UPI0034DE11E1
MTAVSARPMLVLASGSPRRLALLQQAGIEPGRLMPADIDETPQRSEHPRSLAKRLSKTKAEVTAARLGELDADPAYILAADTVVSVGRQIMPKADLVDDAVANLRTLSGRTHHVYTGVCLIGPRGAVAQRLIETRVRFKRLSRLDLDSYIASGEWRGKAGGYAIQGLAGAFVVRIVGSYTNVVGLPLYETLALLGGEGYDIHAGWKAPAMDMTDDGAGEGVQSEGAREGEDA